TSTVPASEEFQVAANTSLLLLSAEWDNPGATSTVQVAAPDGTLYSTAAPGGGNPISVVNQLSGPGLVTVGILDPTPGRWRIQVPDVSPLGSTRFEGFVNSTLASVALTSNALDASSQDVTIGHDDQEGSYPATVSFYYGDQAGADVGVPIALNLPV